MKALMNDKVNAMLELRGKISFLDLALQHVM